MDADTPPDLPMLIRQELAGYESLLTLLEEERTLLVSRDFDAFASLLGRKHELVTQLDQAAALRGQLLQQYQLDSNEAGVIEYLGKLPETEQHEAQAAWDQLKSLVTTCSHKNEVNARIAHRAQATTRHILNILRGNAAPDLYNKSGVHGDRGPGHSITSA